MDTPIIYFVYTICVIFFIDANVTEGGCDSPQYLELWTKGTISCSFEEGFFGVFWYNFRNYVSEEPIMFYQEFEKGGDGYSSGEFDIFPNGSLIINNVSLRHDHIFTAVRLNDVSDDFSTHVVNVLAMVKPFHPYPFIKPCGNKGPPCFSYWMEDSSIECSVRDSRPAVSIEWFARTANGDWKIPSNINITERGIVKTSCSRTTSPFEYSSLISLLVCKAWSPEEMLDTDESLIFVQNGKMSLKSVIPVTKFFPIYSNAVLHCTEEAISFLVWKIKKKGDTSFRNILFAFWDGDLPTKQLLGNYDVTANGSLIIPHLKVHHEAIYGCIYGNGSGEGMATFETLVFVPPVPLNLDVKGCMGDTYCSLHTERQGNLTCTVKGIRPIVKLEWKALDVTSTVDVFRNQQTTIVHNHDDTFDISATISYNGMFYPHTSLSVKCQVIETNIGMLRLSKHVELIFNKVTPTATHKEAPTEITTSSLIMTIAICIAILIVVLIVIFCVKGIFLRSRHPTPNVNVNAEVMTPFLETGSGMAPFREKHCLKKFQSKTEVFVSELKGKYEALCAAIKPVPFIQDKMCGIEKVFVEGGLHFLNVRKGLAMMEEWEPLKSYQDVFTDSRLKSNRKILEGDLGYGKSTLALQWAFEWLTNDEQSHLKDVEILILLRLRQLGNCHSIFSAIQHFLLPIDTRVSPEDIEEIIHKSDSVVFILDGFDEYPIQNTEEPSNVMSIIKQDMLLDCNVILTTRSLCLPSEYAPQTKRIKLDGFDDKARAAYLLKAVVGNNSDAAESIKDKLRVNPFLDSLCQVPLFFVMFAHLAKEDLDIADLKTVTMFFRHVISCLHNHMENKTKDQNVRQYQWDNDNHYKLNMESFLALLGESTQHVWLKENIRETIGHECYDWYVRTGILVEENVRSSNDNPYDLCNHRLQYKTEVHFYHKLFCEWYAAHFLAEYLENPNKRIEYNDALGIKYDDAESKVAPPAANDNQFKNNTEDELLQKLDPCKLQYLYRFTCGLSPIAAEKVCEHLKKTSGGDKFYIFCLFEQPASLPNLDTYLKTFCSTYIIIHKDHTKLMQISTCQLLRIASQRQITIEEVKVFDCFQSTEMSGQYLLIKSGIKLPILRSLRNLVISDGSRELTDEIVTGIFSYSSRCSKLMGLRFDFCLLPQTLKAESLSPLKKQKIKVLWHTKFSGTYSLNTLSGQWEHQENGEVMGNNVYTKVVKRFIKAQQVDMSPGSSH